MTTSIDKKQQFGMIKNMINYTKKWWLLGCHRRAERIHSTRGSADGKPVLLSQEFFITGNIDKEPVDKWYGLANKYPGKVSGEKKYRYVRFRLSWLKFWEKEYDEEKLKVMKNNYWNIYETCVKEGYITKTQGVKIVDGKNIIMEFPTTCNPKSYNIRGFPLGYFQGLFLTYDKVWIAIGALIIAIIGSTFFANMFIKKDVPQNPNPAIQIYPTITSPDVNPIINVYPNK